MYKFVCGRKLEASDHVDVVVVVVIIIIIIIIIITFLVYWLHFQHSGLLKLAPIDFFYSKIWYGFVPGNLFIKEIMAFKAQCPFMTSLRQLVYSASQQRGNGSKQPSGPPDHLYSSTQKCSEGC